jgi:hypothetical protein
VPDENRVFVDVAILKVLLEKHYWSAYLWIHGMHNVEPKYFVHGGRLFAEASGWIYAWLHEAGNWMVWVEGNK